VVGTFISLLWNTAKTQDEADQYKEKLEEYRWTLRLSSKSAEILDRAASMLATSTGLLVKAIPVKTVKDASEGSEESEGDGLSEEASEAPQASDMSMQASPSYSEGAFALLWQDFSMAQPDAHFDTSVQFQAAPDGSHENSFLGPDTNIQGFP
jgi:hypothetical protein